MDSNTPLTDLHHSLLDGLRRARQEELRGWPKVAAFLHAMQGTKWWVGYADNEAEALAMPELQIPSSTANQYRVVWSAFGHLPIAELEETRPRLLYVAAPAVLRGDVSAEDALSDAQVFSWSAYNEKYGKPRLPS